MQVFAIFALGNPDDTFKRVQAEYPVEDYLLVDGAALVASRGVTTKQVAQRLHLSIEAPPSSAGIVVPITTYWGYHNPDIWEWIRAKQEHNGD